MEGDISNHQSQSSHSFADSSVWATEVSDSCFLLLIVCLIVYALYCKFRIQQLDKTRLKRYASITKPNLFHYVKFYRTLIEMAKLTRTRSFRNWF